MAQIVDDYIAAFPQGTQDILQKVRQTITSVIPDAIEVIGYGIPSFRQNGVYIVHFAGYKDHIGVYPIPHGNPTLQKQLDPYKRGKGTLRFGLDAPVPYDLIARAIRQLLQESLERTRA